MFHFLKKTGSLCSGVIIAISFAFLIRFNYIHKTEKMKCSLSACFGASRCSPRNRAKLHVYNSLGDNDLNMTVFKSDSGSPCMNLAVIDMELNSWFINSYLSSLEFWNKTGQNHILYLHGETNYCDKLNQIDFGLAILVLTYHCENVLTRRYHFYVPGSSGKMGRLPEVLPLKRRHLLSFVSRCSSTESDIVRTMALFSEVLLFQYDACGECIPESTEVAETLSKSVFTLIIADNNVCFLNDITRAFKHGCIPILVGDLEILPFTDFIDWKEAIVVLHKEHIDQLISTLGSYTAKEISAFKIQGRFLLETYFMSSELILQTTVEVLKYRVGALPSSFKQTRAKIIYSSSKLKHNRTNNESIFFRRSVHDLWNTFPGGLHQHPVNPWTPILPSFHQFTDDAEDMFQQIKLGDSFSDALGGDSPHEKYTIVMLVYDRVARAAKSIQSFKRLKHLDKIVVIFNHQSIPLDKVHWPKIGVRIEVIRGPTNSLNNRFIPYSNIETEAILSMDDDVVLENDGVDLAFRVWRENRDRIVGFAARSHAFDGKSREFVYYPKQSCEISMILTGAAFFHKYYSFVYTHQMNALIREKVDEYLNCEDIAMNFLVAHVTQKPPIKVTGRLMFLCKDCKTSLSLDEEHYAERDACMAYFAQVYGYNPLKKSQYRADSMFYKNILPRDIKKCYIDT